MNVYDAKKDLEKFVAASGDPAAEITLVAYDKNIFGNAIITVTLIGVEIRVTLDRGQTFLDIWDEKLDAFIKAESVIQEFQTIQQNGRWTLRDQLEAIAVHFSF
jgi:hypothetical protein